MRALHSYETPEIIAVPMSPAQPLTLSGLRQPETDTV